MKAWIRLFLAVLILVAVSFTSAATPSSQYLYDGKKENTAVIEYKEGVDFKSSTAPKIVVFYSPYCG